MKYTLKIPNPCNEKWNEMTPTEKGAFCSKCNKEVFDFTLKSKSDLARILDQNEKICGRYRKEHLDTDITSLRRQKYSRLGLMFGFATLFSISSPVYSQIDCQEGIVFNEKQQEEKREYFASRKVGDSIRIEGTITDGNWGLPGVLVRLKNQSKTEKETDFDGKFNIKVLEKDLRKNLTLELINLGYETQEIQINEKTEYLNIILKEEELLMGEVVIIKRQNIFRKIGNIFKSKD